MMRRQTNLPALNCIQYNASKKVVSEQDVVASNKQGFGSSIGAITNRITAMTSLMSNYDKDSIEYQTLRYRTQCGQSLQQSEIDKVKGIIATPMPKEWYVYGANRVKDDDEPETIEHKHLNQRICAYKKPYFFGYNYPSLKVEYDQQIKEINSKLISMFGKTLSEMQESDNLTQEELEILDSYVRKLCLDLSPSTMNRICWAIEDSFDQHDYFKDVEFDFQIYKSGVSYTIKEYEAVKQQCIRYLGLISNLNKQNALANGVDVYDKDQLLLSLEKECFQICSSEKKMCDILIDLCYGDGFNKGIVWNLCGDVIISNLLKRYGYTLTYPACTNNGKFVCCGKAFTPKTICAWR